MVKCTKCGAELALKIGPYGPFLQCQGYPKCDIAQACTSKGEPVGEQSDHATREARQEAHRVFDVVWKSGRLTRTEAYAWLADKLGLPKQKAHIGQFDVETCKKVVAHVRKAQAEEAMLRRIRRGTKQV